MKENKKKYRELILDDCALLPELLRKVWGIGSDKEFWKWKYFLPPFEAAGWIVEDVEKKIAAFTGYWARKTKLGDRETNLLMLADVMAAPDQRDGRVYGTISGHIKKLLEERLVFGFTNKVSHNLFKATMSDFVMIEAHIPIYTLPINAGVFLDFHIYAKKAVGTISCLLIKSLLHFSKERKIHVERVEQIGNEFQQLWENVKYDYYAIQYRGKNFLEWRYLESPYRKYQIWRAKKDGFLVGYMVTTITDEPELRRGFIVDWLVSKKNRNVFKEMIRTSVLWMIQNNVDVVETWMPTHEKDWRNILKRLFFLKNKRTRGFLLGGEPFQFRRT